MDKKTTKLAKIVLRETDLIDKLNQELPKHNLQGFYVSQIDFTISPENENSGFIDNLNTIIDESKLNGLFIKSIGLNTAHPLALTCNPGFEAAWVQRRDGPGFEWKCVRKRHGF